MNSPLTGLKYVAQGFILIRQPGLRRYALIPVLINVLVFAGLGWLLFAQFSQWLEGLSVFTRWDHIWLVRQFGNLIEFLFGIALFLIALYSFTLVANILGSPFNALLAEKVEQRLRGPGAQIPALDHRSVVRSVLASLWSEIVKIGYLFRWLIPLGILYVIPGLQPVAFAATLLLGAWMFALEYMDYPMGNHGMGFRQVREQVRQRRALHLGFGAGVTLVTAIPILNLVAMPVAVAAATSLWVDFYPRGIPPASTT